MTRVLTVSDLKNGKPHGRTGDGKPRPGSRMREAYDALRRGETVNSKDYSPPGRHHTTLYNQLRDIWGMVLERVGSHEGMRLVGEWEGPYFVPIERILQEEQADDHP